MYQSQYQLDDLMSKLKDLHRDIETKPIAQSRAVIQEALERLQVIGVMEENQRPFVFQIKLGPKLSERLAIGTEGNVTEALVRHGISRQEAAHAAVELVSILDDDLPALYEGENFKVAACQRLV